jgi:hypothetical protein
MDCANSIFQGVCQAYSRLKLGLPLILIACLFSSSFYYYYFFLGGGLILLPCLHIGTVYHINSN